MPSFTCWSCGKERAPAEALCPHCGKVQPPPPGTRPDKFAVLGLSRGYQLDDGLLDEKFRALSRKLHPDRFARASPRERRFSLEQTTLLNDAYRTLQSPVRRAEHLLELRGVKVLPESQGTALPLEFLEEAMEDREKLLEAKLEGGPEAVEALAAGIRTKRDAAMDELARIFAALEAQGARPEAADLADPTLAQAAGLLARLRYFARYLDDALGRDPEI